MLQDTTGVKDGKLDAGKEIDGKPDKSFMQRELIEQLEQRLGRIYVQQRLGIEKDHEEIFGYDIAFPIHEHCPNNASPDEALHLNPAYHAFLTNSRLDLIQTLGALKGIRDDIQKRGLSWERDHGRLEEVFGKAKEPFEETEEPNEKCNKAGFIRRYWEAAERSHDSTEVADQNGEAIGAELDKLIEYLDGINRRWFDEEELERYRASTAALIPSPEVAEKLLRYQITLERSIERTMAQIEGLQQTRLGQPFASPTKVQIAG
jgi:hypothetical protein